MRLPDSTAAVAARTTGPACERARVLLASAADEALGPADMVLVRAHVAGCRECGLFESALGRALEGLPALAVLVPGPLFAAEVLARTSRRPASPAWAARARAAWQGVVRRPRFAWEAAYVCTLCWLLVFVDLIAALDWTTARVGAAARTAVPARIETAQVHVKTLRDQVVGEVARTAEGLVEAGRASATGAARTWQQQAAAWAMDQASAFADRLSSSWNTMAAWFAALFTEPPPAPARYSK